MHSNDGNKNDKKTTSSKLKVDKTKLVELTMQDVEQVAGGAGANSGAMFAGQVGGGGLGGNGGSPPVKTKAQAGHCVK